MIVGCLDLEGHRRFDASLPARTPHCFSLLDLQSKSANLSLCGDCHFVPSTANVGLCTDDKVMQGLQLRQGCALKFCKGEGGAFDGFKSWRSPNSTALGPIPFRTLTLQMPACHYMGIGLDSL